LPPYNAIQLRAVLANSFRKPSVGVVVSTRRDVNCASEINLISCTLSALQIANIDCLSRIVDGELN
jgi:hypothetical protein